MAWNYEYFLIQNFLRQGADKGGSATPKVVYTSYRPTYKFDRKGTEIVHLRFPQIHIRKV